MLLTADPLSNLLFLSDQLFDQAKKESLAKETLGAMWAVLAQRFGKYVAEVSGCGTLAMSGHGYLCMVDFSFGGWGGDELCWCVQHF